MLRITVIDVTPKEAKPGDTVTVKYAIENDAESNKCYRVNIWWRSEKVSGDFVSIIPGHTRLDDVLTFTMPDKPENPTKFTLNVYEGTGLIDIPPYCRWFNDAPDDSEVFEVTKMEQLTEIRLNEPPYFVKIEDPKGVLVETSEGWQSSRIKGDPYGKIYVKLPKGKFRFKYKVVGGWNQLYLYTSSDEILWKRDNEWGSGTFYGEVDIPETGVYYFKPADGGLEFETVLLYYTAWVENPLSFCETACETSCQTACETSCQQTCELACQQSCEQSCQQTCEVSCQQTCERSCQTACETACQQSCEQSCQQACELTSQACTTTCELSCQQSCEQSCQQVCETSCQQSCETSCQTACETSCQQSCELTSQACTTACEQSCQTACETTSQAPAQNIVEMVANLLNISEEEAKRLLIGIGALIGIVFVVSLLRS